MCYNMRLHKLVDCIDINIDEGIPIKYIQINNVEADTEDTVEDKEEKVQESEKEDSELDDESSNTQADSRQRTKKNTFNNH